MILFKHDDGLDYLFICHSVINAIKTATQHEFKQAQLLSTRL